MSSILSAIYAKCINQKHSLPNPSPLRTQVFNWMQLAGTQLKIESCVVFHALTLFDKLSHLNRNLTCEGQVFLIGSTCLFIASKFGENVPLSAKTVCSLLSDFHKAQIMQSKHYQEEAVCRKLHQAELELLAELQWDLTGQISFFEIIDLIRYQGFLFSTDKFIKLGVLHNLTGDELSMIDAKLLKLTCLVL